MSAAMVSGVCVPSAAVTGVCVAVHYLVLHGTLEEIQNDIYSIVLAPQVTVKIQRISQDLLRSIGIKYLQLYDFYNVYLMDYIQMYAYIQHIFWYYHH